MIVLHTLGDTLILVGDRKVRPSSPLVFASLLYLAMERGRRVPRAALQELLFPKSDERSGAHSVRQLLYKLRQLGAPLECDALSVMMPVDRVSDAGTSNEGAQAANVLFLPDYEPDISSTFSEWLEQKRAEVAKEVRARLVSAIETHREALNWPAVERDAQLLLSIDPFNEVGTFALAEAAALSGGKATAIKILSDYERETGRTDLRLPASLLRRRITQAVPEPVATLSVLPFVGREAEVKELRKYIARARAGQPCMYVIGGEAGIGKTRLLSETAGLAALEGVNVFTVRCQAHYGSRPLSVFIELVPALRAAPGALGVSPESLSSLNSLTSHTDEVDDTPVDSRDNTTRAELLLGAIRDLVDAVSHEHPLLVVVEDAHWADTDSLRELNRLAQGTFYRPLIIVCSTRTPDSFPLSPSVDDRTIVRRLKPMGNDALGTLVQQLLPTHGLRTSGLLEWLVQTSGGNPLFLQMLCGHYSKTSEPFSVPLDVLSAVTQRVQQLPSSQQRILSLCALLSKHTSLRLLHTVVGRGRLELLDAIQRLEEEGYLVIDGESIRLAHDLLGQATLSLLPPISRRLLHGCVAAALEKEYDSSNDASVLWDCAVQWEQSGDSNKAVEFLIKCARHAVRIGRASEAVTLLARAETSARSVAEQTAVLRESVLSSRAAVQWALTRRHAQRLLQLQPNGLEHSPHEFAVFHALWNTEFLGNDSVNCLRRCVHASDASTGHRIDAAYLMICIAHETGNAALAHDAFHAVRELLNPHLATSASRVVAATYEMAFGDISRGRAMVEEALANFWYFDSVADELRAAVSAAGILTLSGDNDRAIDLAMKYLAKCEALGLNSWRVEFQTHVCMFYCIKEEYDIVADWLKSIDRDGHSLDGASALRLLGCRVELSLHEGDVDTALRLLQSAELSNLGDSVRGRAYFKSLDVRVRQIAPAFQVPDDTLAALCELYGRTKNLSCADSLVLAYGEALRRRAMHCEVNDLLNDYLTGMRRELGPASPSLQRFVESYRLSGERRRLTPTMSAENVHAASTELSSAPRSASPAVLAETTDARLVRSTTCR